MKLKIAVRLNIILISSLVCSCSVEPNKTPASSVQNKTSISNAPQIGEFVFDCYDVNYAWGYRLSGFFIDRLGKVYRYRLSGTPWKPKLLRQGSSLYYAAAELVSKFTNKTLWTNIDATVMQDKIALIDNAATGAVTYRNMRGADQGRNVCIAYRYVANKNLYEQIELGSYGATQIQTANAAPEAQALLQWLATIGAK